MGNAFLKINKQLNYLMENHVPPIKNAEELAQLMLDAGILEYSSDEGINGKDIKKDESKHNYAKSINNHLNGLRVSVDWIKRYCEFFNCSSDYLYGLIDYPTHEITDIVSEIGLDAESITRLQNMNKYRNFNSGLCKLIKCDSFGDFMMNWEQYLSFSELFNECRDKFREQLIQLKVIKKKDDLSDNDYLLQAHKCANEITSPLRDISLQLIKYNDDKDYTAFKLQQSIFSIEHDSDSTNNKSTHK